MRRRPPIERDVYGLVRHGVIVAAYPEHGVVFISHGGEPVRMSLWMETADGSFVEEETRTLDYFDPEFAAKEWYERLLIEFGDEDVRRG